MRIYITSRNRTPSSASSSDFQFALERPIELPEGAHGSIDSFTCSNVWEAVLPGVNFKLYCQWSGHIQRIASIETGDVQNAAALAAKVQTAIDNLGESLALSVDVTAVGNRLQFDCPGLTGSETFTVFARPSLGGMYTTQPNGFQDACGLIGALSSDLVCLSATAAAAASPARSASVVGGFINLAPYQTIYLHSHIGDNDSYGPNGESTVIASIVVGNTVPGDLITHHHNGLLASPIQLPPLLGIMHFSLRSYEGKVIETDGHDIAFTLVVETTRE